MPVQGSGRAVLVQGAGGGIGLAMVHALLRRPAIEQVFTLSRRPDGESLVNLARTDSRVVPIQLDLESAASPVAAAARVAERTGKLDLLVNCAGVLHDAATGMEPERRLAEVRAEHLAHAFRINAVGSLLMAQAFESLLRRGEQPLFASISARVGSIADNRLGGWYAYRASKAALNMSMKTLAIEWGRGTAPIRVIALHPGTVATSLSAPFARVGDSSRRIFEPALAAEQLLSVLDGVGPGTSGIFLDWEGKSIDW